MGIRSRLRRFVQPAAMVGVVGMLPLSLIVTTPSTAQALTPKLPVSPTFIMGAVKTVAPVAMAAVSITPVGWGLRLLQLGMLAYSTSDLWMPFVTGAFGGATAVDTPAGSGASNPYPDVRLSGLSISGQSANVTHTYTGSDSAYQYGALLGITSRFQCKNNTSGTIRTELKGVSSSFGLDNGGGPRARTINIACSGGETMVGIKVGAFGSAPDLSPWASSAPANWRGPANVVTIGTTGGNESFDPRGADVTYQGKSECISSAGTIAWATGPSVPGDNGAMLMPSCEKAGLGHGTGRTTVTALREGGGTQTVWDTGATPLMDPATPLCDPGRASSGCTLEVLKDDLPCRSGDVECENWEEEAPKNPQRWKCKFGPYTLPLSACNLLEQAYAPGGSPVNDENTDGNPATRSLLGPSGQPAPAPAPVTAPGAGTSGDPVPGAAGQPGPGAEPEESACWPTGWGMLNPLEWVYKPVVCAAKALFQPKTSLQTRVTTMKAQFDNRIPVSWFGGEISGPSTGTCPTSWQVTYKDQSYPFICGTQAEGIIRGFRPVLGGMLIVAMLWPLLRSLFYAAIPIFKVTPS